MCVVFAFPGPSYGSASVRSTSKHTDVCLTVEFATLTLDAEKRPKAKIYKPAEIDALLVKHDLAKKDEDTEMRAA